MAPGMQDHQVATTLLNTRHELFEAFIITAGILNVL